MQCILITNIANLIYTFVGMNLYNQSMCICVTIVQHHYTNNSIVLKLLHKTIPRDKNDNHIESSIKTTVCLYYEQCEFSYHCFA